MKIAIAIDNLNGGGAPKVMISLANELASLGHEPHFLLMDHESVFELDQNINVHFCFDQNYKGLKGYFRVAPVAKLLVKKIREIEEQSGKFDLFLSNLDKTNLIMIESKVSPLFVVIHSSVEEELKRHAKMGPFKYLKKLRSKKALNGQNLVTVSKGIENEIINKKRINPKSINTIYNPFDIERIKSLSNKDNSNIPTFDYLIHVGRFVAQKRHDILFRSIKNMKNELPIVFLSHKPEAIMKMARKFGIEDRVIAPDFQLNPYPWIKRAKGLVLSSDFEGLPTVLIEALICETPVVSTKCPHGPIEILTGDLDHFLVPTGDYKNLARVTDEMLESYPNMDNLDILERVQSKSVAIKYLRLLHEY